MKNTSLSCLVAALAALSLPACVAGPNNDGLVESRSSPVKFWGYTAWASDNVDIYNSATRNGTYTKLATAVSNEAATNMQDGSPAYDWSREVVLTKWTRKCGYYETFAKVRNARNIDFSTYDWKSVATFETRDCMDAAYKQGLRADEVWAECASEQSPVIRLEAPVEYVGNITIRTQADLDALACVGRIRGNLTITSLMDFSQSLPELREVTGDLIATLKQQASSEYEVASTLAMPKLKRVGGELVIETEWERDSSGRPLPTQNRKDIEVYVFTPELISAREVTLDLRSEARAKLRALPNLPSVERLTILNADYDLEAVDFLPRLETVSQSLTWNGARKVGRFLPELRSVGKNLYVDGPTLTAEQFPALQSISGTLVISRSVSAPAANARQFPALRDVDTLELASSDVQAARLGRNLVVDHLAIHDTNLTTLAADFVRVRGAGSIRIRDNRCLPSVAANAFLAQQRADGFTGTSDIGNNGRGTCN